MKLEISKELAEEGIDGSPVASLETRADLDGATVAETKDGRMWVWAEASYRVEPNTPLIYDGEWKELI